MAELDVKWEGMEELNQPNLVIGVPCLRGYLLALGRPTKEKVPPCIQLRAQIQAAAYIMGDAIEIGFLSVLWGQGRMIS